MINVHQVSTRQHLIIWHCRTVAIVALAITALAEMLEQDVQQVSGQVNQMLQMLPLAQIVLQANIVPLQAQELVRVVTVGMDIGVLQVQVWSVLTIVGQVTIAHLVLEQDVYLENGQARLLHLLLLLVMIVQQVNTVLLLDQILILVLIVWMESGLLPAETLLVQMIVVEDITVHLVVKQHARRELGQVLLLQQQQDLALNVLSGNITYHLQQLNQVIRAYAARKTNIKI